ncbi:triacylglycerol lipase [Necator americanus]|uniref:Triacylglycerol lipase n=1 Tax=Necator americanus TaxID=51031 RepID=W2T7A5_NECAM|nr:triacylglycerol lipase [Necator americanus]ETN76872.1 triacylglycerol lipase [Necator americanus]
MIFRSDLGNTGSFGGKTNENDTIVNDPVIFVHGVSDVAGLKMQAVASHYRAFGYTDGELYSTSYGYGARLNPLQWTLYSMKCEHVKQVAGLTVPACALGTLPICDRVVGLYSGLCPLESEFLNDINRNHHYEGKLVYTIYSHIDEKIGYKVCDKVTSSINGEDDHKSFRNLNHDETLDTTYGLQISMIQGRFGGRTQNGVGETNSTDSDVKQIDSLNNVSIHNETISLDEGGGLNVSNIEVQQKTDVTQSSKLEKEEYDDSQLNNIDKIRRFFHEQKYDLLNDDRITSFSSVDSSNNEVGPLFTDENTKKPNSSNNTDNVGTSGYHTRISFRID